jgi:WD40 repeat protein
VRLRGLLGAVLALAASGCGTPPPAVSGDSCLLTFRGHEGWISALAFSPDGGRIVSGGDDRVLKVWDSRSGREQLELRGHEGGVACAAFSPDGARIASGSWGGGLKLWDARSGKELFSRRGHAETIRSLAFSPDGKLLVTGSEDDTLKVWDLEIGEDVMTLEQGDDYDVTAVGFSPDGLRIVTGDGENRVRVWDARVGEKLMTLSGHEGTVIAVAFSPDGRSLVSGSMDGTLRLWDAGSGREIRALRGHAGDVTSVAFSSDGQTLASGSEDDTVRVWDARSGKELMVLRGHGDDVTSVSFSPDGRRIVSGSRGLLKIWKAPAPIEPISGVYRAEVVEASPVLAASGLAWWDGRLIIAERVPAQLRAFTPPDRFEVLRTLTHPVGVAVDSDGHLIVTEKEKDVLLRVARFKRDGREETLAAGEGVGSPHFLAAHPNGTIYWSGFPDGGTRYLRPGAGTVTVAEPRIVHTYGIGLSPGHDWLYVNSKIPNPDRRGTWRFPVDGEGRLGRGEFFIRIDQYTTTHLAGLPPAQDGSASLKGWVGRLQGLAVDKLGHLYVAGAESHTSGSAVAVFTPDGKTLAAMIVGVPRNVSGLAFGGPDGRTLYITGAGEYKLHQVRLQVPGEVLRD